MLNQDPEIDSVRGRIIVVAMRGKKNKQHTRELANGPKNFLYSVSTRKILYNSSKSFNWREFLEIETSTYVASSSLNTEESKRDQQN